MEIPMKELAMQTIARIYIPLLRKAEWPKVNLPKVNILGLARSLSNAVDLYRKALSATYLVALCLDRRNERFRDEDLEGRDPRW
jgi:hypothetical protein